MVELHLSLSVCIYLEIHLHKQAFLFKQDKKQENISFAYNVFSSLPLDQIIKCSH